MIKTPQQTHALSWFQERIGDIIEMRIGEDDDTMRIMDEDHARALFTSQGYGRVFTEIPQAEVVTEDIEEQSSIITDLETGVIIDLLAQEDEDIPATTVESDDSPIQDSFGNGGDFGGGGASADWETTESDPETQITNDNSSDNTSSSDDSDSSNSDD